MAATAYPRIIKNAPYRHSWIFRDSTGDIQTGVTNITSQFSKDFGGLNNTAAPSHQASTLYYVDFTADNMNADVVEHYIHGDNTTKQYFRLEPEPALDSGVATGSASSSINLPTTASATGDLYNGAEIELVRGPGRGQTRAITDYASRVVTVDRPWISGQEPTTDTVYVIHPHPAVPLSTAMRVSSNMLEINSDATAAANLEAMYEGAFVTSSVDDGSPSTTTFVGAAGLTLTDDFYNNMFCVFTSGNMAGIARRVTDYDGTGTVREFTTAAFPSPGPANTDTFILISVVP